MSPPAAAMTRKPRKSGHFRAVLVAVMPGLAAMADSARATVAAASELRPTAPQRTTPPARDPEQAVEEEYQMASRHGTVEALELFLARHPDGPLAEKARADLQRIKR